MNYHCITAEECRNLNIDRSAETLFIPFQGVCQEGCPKDFQVKFAVDGNKMSASCTPCLGRDCWRTCKAQLVDGIPAAQALSGCQIIDGNLDIQIGPGKSENLIQELENSLSSIVEIKGYLKIARTSIASLSFLRNLKVIKGKHLESEKYSLIVWDNKNLEQLFANEKVEIENGKIILGFNPRLCFNDAESSLTTADKNAIEHSERASLSNGYEKLCNVTQLEVKVIDVQAESSVLQWNPLKLVDQNSAISYAVFYSESDDESGDDK